MLVCKQLDHVMYATPMHTLSAIPRTGAAILSALSIFKAARPANTALLPARLVAFVVLP